MRIQSGVFLVFAALAAWGCNSRKSADPVSFSPEDFVTESYLAYQDSLLHAWNMMMSDDNEKLSVLHALVTELRTDTREQNQDMLKRFDERLTQLQRIRYTQKSMANADVIEEYDFACTSLVREILSMAEASTAYAENVKLQQLVDHVRLAEERVENYRADYDDLVSHYNAFLDDNKRLLVQINRDSLKKKPRFELVSIQ